MSACLVMKLINVISSWLHLSGSFLQPTTYRWTHCCGGNCLLSWSVERSTRFRHLVDGYDDIFYESVNWNLNETANVLHSVYSHAISVIRDVSLRLKSHYILLLLDLLLKITNQQWRMSITLSNGEPALGFSELRLRGTCTYMSHWLNRSRPYLYMCIPNLQTAYFFLI